MKFINQKSNQVEEEVKNIELLKQRFGQNKLNNCMILVKDVKDSGKLSARINQQAQLPFEFNVLILSRDYWPVIQEQDDTHSPSSVPTAEETQWLDEVQETY